MHDEQKAKQAMAAALMERLASPMMPPECVPECAERYVTVLRNLSEDEVLFVYKAIRKALR